MICSKCTNKTICKIFFIKNKYADNINIAINNCKYCLNKANTSQQVFNTSVKSFDDKFYNEKDKKIKSLYNKLKPDMDEQSVCSICGDKIDIDSNYTIDINSSKPVCEKCWKKDEE